MVIRRSTVPTSIFAFVWNLSSCCLPARVRRGLVQMRSMKASLSLHSSSGRPPTALPRLLNPSSELYIFSADLGRRSFTSNQTRSCGKVARSICETRLWHHLRGCAQGFTERFVRRFLYLEHTTHMRRSTCAYVQPYTLMYTYLGAYQNHGPFWGP